MSKENKQSSAHVIIGKKAVVALVFISLLAGALAIPFAYETQTLWYKSGADKTMLRVGQMAGLLALIFLILQIILAIRPGFLSNLYGGQSLVRWHRISGVLIAVSGLAHVLLVLLPEGLGNLPVGWKYWPEIIGMLTLLGILLTVAVSSFRNRLHLNYISWRLWHRIIGYMLPILACIHVLFVSESFQKGVLKPLLITGVAVMFLLVVYEKIKVRKTRKRDKNDIKS